MSDRLDRVLDAFERRSGIGHFGRGDGDFVGRRRLV
jgi:hypothetical protein